MVLASPTWAGSVKMEWQASANYTNGEPIPENVDVRYRIYYGEESRGALVRAQDFDYDNDADVGDNLDAEVTGIQPGSTWYFAATAIIDRDGTEFESDYSNEVRVVFPPLDPGTPDGETPEPPALRLTIRIDGVVPTGATMTVIVKNGGN